MILLLVPLFFFYEKAYAKEFKVEYEKHGIDDLPFHRRALSLRYAIFLQCLIDKGYSNKDIARLKCIAELVGNPKPPPRLSQYPLSVSLIAGSVVAIVALLFRESGFWTWPLYVLLFYTSLLVGICFFLYSHLNMLLLPKVRRQYIWLFLQWAELDIKDEFL
jgi:hypothetical protein